MAFLTIRTDNGRRIHELGATAIIGRGGNSDVLMDDARSSKQHAEISRQTSGYVVKDLNSSNGTIHNGSKLSPNIEIELNDGDEIVIGGCRMQFTRGIPAGAEDALARAHEDDQESASAKAKHQRHQTGVIVKERPTKDIPSGTMVFPLERLALRDGAAASISGEGFAPTTSNEDRVPTNLGPDFDMGSKTLSRRGGQWASDVGLWLRCLYRMLREANTCATEDELFEVAVRIIKAGLPGANVRILFEAKDGVAEGGKKKKRASEVELSNSLKLVAWQPTKVDGGQVPRVEEAYTDARKILLTYARERGVAVLSMDVDADDRVANRVKRSNKRNKNERLSLLIAPLLQGRSSLGYIVAERIYEVDDGGRPVSEKSEPFQKVQLEFLAAAAYPLATVLVNLRKSQSVMAENKQLRMAVEDKFQIIGNAPALKRCLSVVERAAPFNSAVLILGESGTGKELIARAIHRMSNRSTEPFEAINCAALPENLVESELFGHAKGAFTGANNERTGYFEIAGKGTLFLDEVGELPALMQAKLLRVLEESKINRVGESRLRDIHCRIVAATNRDLQEEVVKGTFRQDLYYRLRVMEIALPPLRERQEDLAVLCKHLLRPFGNYAVHPDVLDVFRRYKFPGNIRELRNTLERMAVMAKAPEHSFSRSGAIMLTAQDIPLDIREAVAESTGDTSILSTTMRRRRKTAVLTAPSADPMDQTIQDASQYKISANEMPPLEELQVSYAKWVLEQVGGNKTKAAKTLGIQRSTLYSWTEWGKKKKGSDKK